MIKILEILKLKQCKRVGILGGTFNPIHNGHLHIASCAKQEYNLDKVIFIPNGIPPYKGEYVLDSDERYFMTNLATLDNPDFLVSKIEVERKEFSYTIDTIRHIKNIVSSDCSIYFIVGEDTINQVFTWKSADELINLCEFISVSRPKIEINEDNIFIKKFRNSIKFLNINGLDISSTDIRLKIKNNKSISYLLPKNVEEYIYKKNLYKDIDYFEKYQHIIEKLEKNLNYNRFMHSIEVAKEAIKLAKVYDEDLEKAFLAGILHDCAKCISIEDKLNLCKKYGIELDEVMLSNIDLTHSFLGYFVAKDEYNIYDEEILNAIKYHTTGNENMTKLEKITYIADYIEPTREYFLGQNEARKLAYNNLDDAMMYILKNTIELNLKRNRLIHNLSNIALNFYNTKENN